MKKFFTRKMLFTLTALVLIAVMALTLCSCGKGTIKNASETEVQATEKVTSATPVGEGAKTFTFKCVFEDGSEKVYTVSTDKQNVGEALLENKLIDGDEGEFGLYVKTVCDVVADYDVNGAYWAFYEGDNMAMNGCDTTAVKPGTEYSFRYTK